MSVAVDTMARDELSALQGKRLAAMVTHCWDRSPGFWRTRLEEAGVGRDDVASLGDLDRLPTSARPDLQDDQERNPPAGAYACTDRGDWHRMFTTSGTSGRRLRRVLSRHDWDLFVERSGVDMAFRPDDVVMLLGPTDGLFAPSATVAIAAAAGALSLPGGRWDTATKLGELQAWRPTVLVGSASYLLRFTERAAEAGVDLATAGVRKVISAGEPGGAVPATRRLLSERLGGAEITDRYGMTELPTVTRASCLAREGALHLNEDFLIAESLAPGGDEPVTPGEPGELVFTNLVNDTQPVLRYRTGDVGRLSGGEPCECGSPLRRLERSVEGRVDDMIWYHGVNLFPSTIETVVRRLDGLRSDFRVVLRGSRDWPELAVQVEPASPLEGEAAEELCERVRAALQDGLQVRPEVELLEAGELDTGDGLKVERLLDLREGGAAV